MENLKHSAKFWTFEQNNSGGYFVVDDKNGVCECVVVEAQTPDEAWNRLKEIGDKVDGFWRSCNCCGERWSSWLDEEDGKDVPMLYNVPLDEAEKCMFQDSAFVHYLDGTVKEFKFKDKVCNKQL